MVNECVALSAEYLENLLELRNKVAEKPWRPLRVLRLLMLNHRVRKATKLLFAVAEAASLPVLK